MRQSTHADPPADKHRVSKVAPAMVARIRGAFPGSARRAGILARGTYTGIYRDRTADDDGVTPEIEDTIAVPCPKIIDCAQFECIAALRATCDPMESRIDTLETQLSRGSRKITPATVNRFSELPSTKLRDDDPALRSAYRRMFVSDMRVSNHSVVVSGPSAALEAGVAGHAIGSTGTAPSLDREWCPTGDKAGHSDHWKIAISRR